MDAAEKKKHQAERKKVRAAQKADREALRREQRIRVRFQNIEMPGVTLQFTFRGEQFELADGHVYDLPMSVVNHLNSLTTPVYKMYDTSEVANKFRPTPADPSERIAGAVNRFSVIPLSMGLPEEPTPKARGNSKESAGAAA